MKKITLILSLTFFGMLALSSCKKDYTCECVMTDTEDGSEFARASTVIKDKKKAAEETCDKGDMNDALLGLKTECTIK